MTTTLSRADRLEEGDRFHFNHPASPNARTWKLHTEPTEHGPGTAVTVDNEFPLSVPVEEADTVYTL